MPAEWFIAARAVHVASVAVWIGGVFFVTFVLLPALRTVEPAGRLPLFEKLERRFGCIARACILLAGFSGYYLASVTGFWQNAHEQRLWPVHLMIAVWGIFFLLLFVFEPLFLHRKFHDFAEKSPEKAFLAAKIMHWILAALSLAAILAGVMLAHGWSF